MSTKTLQAIKFDKGKVSLEILDQLLLPYSTAYISIESVNDAFQAIKLMQVRGAPAIAIVGAFSVVVDLHSQLKDGTSVKTVADLGSQIEYLISSRPTAVNLANALNDIKLLISKSYTSEDAINKDIYQQVYDYSVSLYEDDLKNNFQIGDNGVAYIVKTLKEQKFKGPFSIVTICNTGSLATSGHGTALGIIRSAYQSLNKEKSSEPFWLEHVYPTETRPYNQGARLTTYELNYENIPFTLVCDNMVTSLINTLNVSGRKVKQSVAPVKFIIVGADRVVFNGDTANKIGTCQLAAISSYFNNLKFANDVTKQIKFMVAAPKTTIDLDTKHGDEIVIEERPAIELTTLKGPELSKEDPSVTTGSEVVVGIATPGISVWNPAFDVTPHELIDSIVTESPEIYTKDANGEFQLSK